VPNYRETATTKLHMSPAEVVELARTCTTTNSTTAAAILGISRPTLFANLHNGTFEAMGVHPLRFAKNWRWPVVELARAVGVEVPAPGPARKPRATTAA